MIIQSEKDVITWVEKYINQVSIKNPISAHIDINGDSSTVITQSLELFEVLLHHIPDHNIYKPMLVIPLMPVDEFAKQVIMFEDCDNLLSRVPPSLYMICRDSSKYLDICEEYKMPIGVPSIPIQEGILLYAYYRIYRDSRALENNWEYERCLYLEGYSKDLL